MTMDKRRTILCIRFVQSVSSLETPLSSKFGTRLLSNLGFPKQPFNATLFPFPFRLPIKIQREAVILQLIFPPAPLTNDLSKVDSH